MRGISDHAECTATGVPLNRESLKVFSFEGSAKERYDTNNDTNVPLRSVPMPHVIDSLVELDGLEPSTSSLRTRRSPN